MAYRKSNFENIVTKNVIHNRCGGVDIYSGKIVPE